MVLEKIKIMENGVKLMNKLWGIMTIEQKNLYGYLNQKLLDSLTADEVRFYAKKIHILLDSIELGRKI